MSSKMLNILIADDELMARRRLARQLAVLDEVTLMAECVDGQQALERLRTGGIDVAILDIQMPGLTGLEVASLLKAPELYVIFATAHPEHALEAFDVGAVDYLLKPIEVSRLEQALERARHFSAKAAPALRVVDRSSKSTLRRLTVSTQRGLMIIDPHEILYAVLEYELVKLVTLQQEVLIAESLKSLEDKLTEHDFMRVHRQSLLNLRYLSALVPLDSGGYDAQMTNGDSVVVSRQSAKRLREWLGID